MTVTINVNGLTLCHEDSGGISAATIPDVCKTPSPGGPVPVPYPNVARSSDLAKGTTTVTADGGHMCAKYGSEFSRSTGDEPGSVGGVKSSTFTKEATWITYSFDVKLEGKGACRLTDKMFHNHRNTVNMSGLVQRMLQAKALLQQMLCDCDKEVTPGPGDTCLSLGNKKHACMERKTAEHNARGGRPKLDGERGYNFKTGKPDPSRLGRVERFRKLAELRKRIAASKAALKTAEAARKISRASRLVRLTPAGFVAGIVVDVAIDMAIDRAIGEIAKLASQADDIGKSLKDVIFPDGAIRGPDGAIDGFLDYKFGCPPGVKSGRGVSTGTSIPDWSPGQQRKVDNLIEAMKVNDPGAINPEATSELLTNLKC